MTAEKERKNLAKRYRHVKMRGFASCIILHNVVLTENREAFIFSQSRGAECVPSLKTHSKHKRIAVKPRQDEGGARRKVQATTKWRMINRTRCCGVEKRQKVSPCI